MCMMKNSGEKEAKNLEKAVKELVKLRGKSSSSLTTLFDEAIKLFNRALESNK